LVKVPGENSISGAPAASSSFMIPPSGPITAVLMIAGVEVEIEKKLPVPPQPKRKKMHSKKRNITAMILRLLIFIIIPLKIAVSNQLSANNNFILIACLREL
jgi:hypothetical protein